jgi:hypothetical protein
VYLTWELFVVLAIIIVWEVFYPNWPDDDPNDWFRK